MADIIDVHIHEHIYTQTSAQALAIPILNADSDRITQPVLLDMYRLKVKLELVPAVPTTVASGRASLAAELHCLTHSCKVVLSLVA